MRVCHCAQVDRHLFAGLRLLRIQLTRKNLFLRLYLCIYIYILTYTLCTIRISLTRYIYIAFQLAIYSLHVQIYVYNIYSCMSATSYNMYILRSRLYITSSECRYNRYVYTYMYIFYFPIFSIVYVFCSIWSFGHNVWGSAAHPRDGGSGNVREQNKKQKYIYAVFMRTRKRYANDGTTPRIDRRRAHFHTGTGPPDSDR